MLNILLSSILLKDNLEMQFEIELRKKCQSCQFLGNFASEEYDAEVDKVYIHNPPVTFALELSHDFYLPSSSPKSDSFFHFLHFFCLHQTAGDSRRQETASRARYEVPTFGFRRNSIPRL